MSRDSREPVALVLGGSRGLGHASAQRLAVRGIPVAICGRMEADVKSATSRLATQGPALGVVADVSDRESLSRAITRVRDALGPIGILVANAGGPTPGSFVTISLEDWDAAYSLTLMSVVQSIREVLPDMRSVGAGKIVIIGSSSIRRPIPGLVLSNTFRPALNGLVKDLSVALAGDGITVNMVAPGRIDTDRVRQLDEAAAQRQGVTVEDVRAVSAKSIPMGRYGRADEFGAMVAFLASEEASYITGQSILVDGGMTASLP